MGATDFFVIGEGKTGEAFKRLQRNARKEYGDDPYNGTISTCDMGPFMGVLSDKCTDDVKKLAYEKAKNDNFGKKWSARYFDLGLKPKGSKTYLYAFYGWAAT